LGGTLIKLGSSGYSSLLCELITSLFTSRAYAGMASGLGLISSSLIHAGVEYDFLVSGSLFSFNSSSSNYCAKGIFGEFSKLYLSLGALSESFDLL